ncbi:hypothetical protein G210_3273 [Candida maltosa Xu316]|uniref:TRP C-terminal domain-containing protein n=1 Tax=Candida maltosa (strain Xu316) TaxID=1245528 RepID=M3J3K6_CANMX|nr:hypothetical protein G210_3273 [Candida maltosa Xu316]
MIRIYILLLILLSYLQPIHSALISSQLCSQNTQDFKLRPFIIDAAVDDENKKLKFFMNSQVANMRNSYSNNYTNVVISDVNYETNRYTTLHIELDFMGKVILRENKRFCEMIAVKNTTSYKSSPRFPQNDNDNNNTTNNNNGTVVLIDPFSSNPLQNDTLVNKRDVKIAEENLLFRNNVTEDLSTSNFTINQLFTNATGGLVQCPLYYNDSIILYYEADISDHFHKLGSYQVKFTVVSNDEKSEIIGCSNAYLTPVQPAVISNIIAIGVLVLMIVTAVVNIFTIAFSTYQESSNPFLFKASTICNPELLKQVDATVPGIITYLQYAFFIGGLDLAYPGFYQPMIGQIKWCALMGFSFVSTKGKKLKGYTDNIYMTLTAGGLASLTKYSSNNPVINNWPDFMVTFVIVTIIVIAFNQSFVIAKILLHKVKWIKSLSSNNIKFNNNNTNKTNFQGFSILSRKNLYLILGQVIHFFLIIFAMPFLILTTFQFLAANDINGKHRSNSNYGQLKHDVFSMSVPYDQLAIPSTVFTFGSQIGIEPTDSNAIKNLKNKEADDSGYRWNYEPGNVTDSLVNTSQQQFLNSTRLREDGTCDYLKISEVSVAFGSILFAAWIGICGFFIFHYLLKVRRFYKVKQSMNISRLYTSLKTLLIWAHLYQAYKPTRVNYVIYDLITLFLKSLVIGVLQNHGIIQVVCLNVISVVDLFALFIYQPYFVKNSWWSSKTLFPVARFLISMLCIPFIRQLEINESVKTYVAYIQLVIHAVVALVFCIQLLYWFFRTIYLIYQKFQNRRHADDFVNLKTSTADSLEDFHRQFVYKPLQPPPSYQTQFQNPDKHQSTTPQKNTLINEENGIEIVIEHADNRDYDEEEEEEDDNDFYYRRKSELILQSMANDENEINSYITSDEDLMPSSSSICSVNNFQQLEHESNLRKIKNDYKVREGDHIYKKYFTDDMIDPEIKEGWVSG